jgi:hypothetical protein
LTRYTDKDGGVSFHAETVSSLARIAAEIESDAVPLVSMSGLNRESTSSEIHPPSC